MTRRSKRIVAVFILVVVVILVGLLWKGGSPEIQPNTTQQVTENNQTPPPQPTQIVADTQAQKVSVIHLSQKNELLLDAVGTVKANEQTKIFPVAAGQVSGFSKDEGEAVEKGETLLKLVGLNGGKSAVLSQLEIASTNYQTALKNLQNTLSSNSTSARTAQLQLESALHQKDGSLLDMQVLQQNQFASRDATNLLRDTLYTTYQKNGYDLERARLGIESLQNSINRLEDQKFDVIDTLQQQIENAATAAEREALEAQLEKQEAEFERNIESLSEQLESAEVGYKSAQEAIILGENQLLQQMAQSESQGKVFYLNEQGLIQKLGLSEGSSDAVRLAQEAVNATLARNAAALTQAQSQVDLAKLNLELAQSQADGLTVKAPFKGIVSEVYVKNGDQVAPQTALLQITGAQSFELKVGVSAENAQRIEPYSLAQVQIGGKFVKVPIRAVAPSIDPTSKLVTVTITLPKITFRNNQTIKVKIPLVLNEGTQGERFFIPLDAVIIGTEEQYVFVVDNGKAKKVNVQTGMITGNRVEVVEGLQPTDVVIVEGAKNLFEGQEVTSNN